MAAIEMVDIGTETAPSPTGSSSAPNPPRCCCRATTLRASILLIIAVCSMSTGGIWFSLLSTTPPVMRVSWRLALTSVFQLPGLARDVSRSTPEMRAMWLTSLPILCANGAVLAVHFSAWSWSIQETTLVHSLLFVSTTPLLLVGWAAVLWTLAMIVTPKGYGVAPQSDGATARSPRPAVANAGETPGDNEDDRSRLVAPPKPTAGISASSVDVSAPGSSELSSTRPAAGGLPCAPSRAAATFLSWGPHLPPTLLEVIGTVVGFAGAVLLTLDVKEEPVDNGGGGGGYSDVATLRGDLVATAGAAAMGVCLALGSGARRWAPLWIYAWTVTSSAAVAAALASYALEPAARSAGLCCGPASLFGWMADPHLFGLLTATAFVSGICGHTFANAALSDVSALVVSVAMLLEPVAGGAIGWAVGVQVGPVSGCTQTTLGPGDMSFVQGPPSPLTLVAAPVLLLGAAGVIVGAREGGMSQRLKQALCRCRSKRPAATVPMEPHAHSISGAAEGVDAPSTDSHPAPCQCDSEASPLASFT